MEFPIVDANKRGDDLETVVQVMYVEIILVSARFVNVLTVVSSATPAVSERKCSLVLGTLSLSFDNSQEAKNLGVGRCSCGGDLWSSEEVRIHRSENCH